MGTGIGSYQNNSHCARLRIKIRSVWRIHRMLVQIQDLTLTISNYVDHFESQFLCKALCI